MQPRHSTRPERHQRPTRHGGHHESDRRHAVDGPAASAASDRTHYLYIAVIVAVVARHRSSAWLVPDFGKELKPLGTGFVNLIKMMIAPVIFCTIVLGIGSVRKAAQVGKVGGLALGYFLVMSTVALAIGLVVGNLIHPGAGLQPDRRRRRGRPAQAAGEAEGTADFLLGIIPTTLFSAADRGLGAADAARRAAGRLRAAGAWAAGEPILRGVEHLQRLVFRVLAMIMWLAPIGAFGAIAGGRRRRPAGRAQEPRRRSWSRFYATCAVFVFVVLGALLRLVTGRQHLHAAALPGPRVPADPVAPRRRSRRCPG